MQITAKSDRMSGERFGQGFYLTPDRDFTYRWAGTDSVVNVYELDEAGLHVLRLDRS